MPNLVFFFYLLSYLKNRTFTLTYFSVIAKKSYIYIKYNGDRVMAMLTGGDDDSFWNNNREMKVFNYDGYKILIK